MVSDLQFSAFLTLHACFVIVAVCWLTSVRKLLERAVTRYEFFHPYPTEHMRPVTRD